MAGIGGIVSDIFPLLELLDNELDTGTGENDAAAALIALTQAQHYFELLCATMPRVLQDTVNIATVANTETTTWTSSVLRLDGIWLLDSAGKPIREILRIDDVGGHAPALPWPIDVLYGNVGSGSPYGYYGNMRNFYWLPLPDAAASIRLYGFISKARFAAATDDFNYPYNTHLAFAQFATKLMSMGSGDDTADLDKLAGQVFRPLLKQLSRFDRTAPASARTYSEFHVT